MSSLRDSNGLGSDVSTIMSPRWGLMPEGHPCDLVDCRIALLDDQMALQIKEPRLILPTGRNLISIRERLLLHIAGWHNFLFDVLNYSLCGIKHSLFLK